MPLAARRRNKPNLGVGIDLRHPLAAGLVGAWVLNEGCGPIAYNLVRSRNVNNGILTAGAATTWAPGRYGHALAMTAATTQYVDCGVILELNGAKQATVFAAGSRLSGQNFVVGRHGTDNCEFGLLLFSNDTAYLMADSGTDRGLGYFPPAPTGDFTVAGIYDSTLAEPLAQYHNGVRTSSLGHSGGGYPVTGGSLPASITPWAIGLTQFYSVTTVGRHDLAFLWAGVALDADEIGQLHDNPWQMFRSPRIFSFYRRLTFTMSAVTGVYTLGGQIAGLNLGRLVGASVGVYGLTGQAASLLMTQVLLASPGAYGLTGQDAGLVQASVITTQFVDPDEATYL